MKMFGYYALHSFINQIRKIFRTWVVLFIAICFGMGILIGFIAGTVIPEDDYSEEEITETAEIAGEEDVLFVPEGADAVTVWDAAEWAVGGVILAVLGYEVLSADKNASAIFLPVDTHLLFSSPLQPQEVLLFRLCLTAGMSVISSIYLFGQMPALAEKLRLSTASSFALLLVWLLTLITGKFLAVFVYLYGTVHTFVRKRLPGILFGLFAAVCGIFAAFMHVRQIDYVRAARSFFNARVSRYIPVWGWLKGIFLYAREGNTIGSLLCLCGMIIFLIAFVYVIRQMKADFYEEALQKSEEKAKMLETAREKGIAVQSSASHKESIQRDGMKHGSGASVFFFRPLYNRHRFARFGFLTKTNMTYLLTIAAVILVCRFVFSRDPLIPGCILLAMMIFYRTMNNPLKEDIDTPYFRLVPENPWKKFLYSLLAGVVNTALDLFPAMLLLWIAAGGAILLFPEVFLLLLSVDFYATTVSVFMDLSAPGQAAASLKQMIQLLFLYFGLVPDGLILLAGWAYDFMLPACAAVFALNCFLGALFTGLCPLFLEPESRKPEPVREISSEEAAGMRKTFSRIGWALSCCMVLFAGGSILIALLIRRCGWEDAGSFVSWLTSVAPYYLFGVPAVLLLTRKIRKQPPEKQDMKLSRWLEILLISEAMMILGNVIGNLVNLAFRYFLPVSQESAVSTLVMSSDLLWTVLFAVILSPIMEELVYRKVLIDCLRPYGERQAMIFSGLMFGLFHGNFSQFFYAAALGMVLAYVYLRTGKLRYSIALHMSINFIGSIIPMLLLRIPSEEIVNEIGVRLNAADLAMIVWLILELLLAMSGTVLFFIQKRKMVFVTGEETLPQKTERKLLYGNAGVIVFILVCAFSFVVSLLQ